MAEAVVATALETIRDLLIHEASFLSGIGNEIQHIQEELQRMQCFLKDADKRQYEDERVRNWIRSIRNLAYRAENVLETYAIEVASRKGKGMKKVLKRFGCIMADGFYLHRIGSEIVNIKAEIANLTTRLQTYDIKLESEGQSSIAANKIWQRKTFGHEVEKHFIGMENNINELVSLILDRGGDHRIVSICGMGGLGKTTLAKKVFNETDVRSHFEAFAWITVGQECHPKNLLQQVLIQVCPEKSKEEIKTMEDGELVHELCIVQKEKKCLVVLDDMWEVRQWKMLSHAFLINAVNCRVLLTTRIKEVAEIGFPHKLNLLSEDEGWQLLKNWTATHGNANDSHVGEKLEEIGRQIVRKCGYLPLAISVIGGVLCKKDTLEEWEIVNRNLDSYLRFGEGMKDNDEVMQILTLSYENLPCHLRSCLLYLAQYPEDTNILVKPLYMMWIAEGMILSEDQGANETLVEVAERYLIELISGSLVQLPETPIADKFESFRIHDLIRDLCVRKCKEEDFLKVMDFRGGKRPTSDINSLGGNAHRLAIYIGLEDNIDDKILQQGNESTRSLRLSCSEYKTIDHRVLKDLGKLEFLRVATFEYIEFSNTKLFQKVIKKLIHLRFLSFIFCKLDVLPSSIGMLPYLQTFQLVSNYKVKIPKVFWNLKRLMHLVLEVYGGIDIRLRLDNSLSGLKICTDQFTIEVKALSDLTNLRVFGSHGRDNESFSLIINWIEVNWRNIRGISLQIYINFDFINTKDGSILLHKLFMYRAIQHLNIEAHIREFPKYKSGMLASSDLVELCLRGCFIGEDPMPTLEKLPKLKELRLLHNSYVGEELICSSIGFPNLIHLELNFLLKLKKWRIDGGAMPNLSYLLIRQCGKLDIIPDGMKFLKALRSLKIDGMPTEFNNRIRVIDGQEGADFHKVCHVPFISIESEFPSADSSL